MAVAHSRRRYWRRALAAGLDRIPRVLEFLRLLQRHLWFTRRRDHTDAVALLHRRRSLDRR
ncbi:hypothetical protein D3C83_221550 [compost metagenome]